MQKMVSKLGRPAVASLLELNFASPLYEVAKLAEPCGGDIAGIAGAAILGTTDGSATVGTATSDVVVVTGGTALTRLDNG